MFELNNLPYWSRLFFYSSPDKLTYCTYFFSILILITPTSICIYLHLVLTLSGIINKKNSRLRSLWQVLTLTVPTLLTHTWSQVHWLSPVIHHKPQSPSKSVRLIYLHVYTSRKSSTPSPIPSTVDSGHELPPLHLVCERFQSPQDSFVFHNTESPTTSTFVPL